MQAQRSLNHSPRPHLNLSRSPSRGGLPAPTLRPFTLPPPLPPELLATWVQLTPEEESPDRILHLSNAAATAAGFLVTLQLRWVFFFVLFFFLFFFIIYLKGSIFCTVNFQ